MLALSGVDVFECFISLAIERPSCSLGFHLEINNSLALLDMVINDPVLS